MPVVRQRIVMELLELLDCLGDVAAHSARACLRNRSYHNRSAYYSAVSRLSRLGQVVKERGWTLRASAFRIMPQKGIDACATAWRARWKHAVRGGCRLESLLL